MTLENRGESQTSRKSVQHKAAIIHVVHAITKTQVSLKRHYYFKLGGEKLMDSEADLRLVLAERRHAKQSAIKLGTQNIK